MRIKSVVAPSRTDKLSVGDEWVSPDGHTPKFRRVWNGTAWENSLEATEVEEELEEEELEEDEDETEDETETEDDDSDESSEKDSEDSTKTEDKSSERSVQTALQAGNGPDGKPVKQNDGKGKPAKKSGVRKGGKGK